MKLSREEIAQLEAARVARLAAGRERQKARMRELWAQPAYRAQATGKLRAAVRRRWGHADG